MINLKNEEQKSFEILDIIRQRLPSLYLPKIDLNGTGKYNQFTVGIVPAKEAIYWEMIYQVNFKGDYNVQGKIGLIK